MLRLLQLMTSFKCGQQRLEVLGYIPVHSCWRSLYTPMNSLVGIIGTTGPSKTYTYHQQRHKSTVHPPSSILQPLDVSFVLN
jgi:hypothetical protein